MASSAAPDRPTAAATPRRAVVLGAGGLLGRAIVRCWPAHGWDVRGLLRQDCDIRNAAAVARALDDATGFAWVVNAAADNDVDGLEDDPARAHAANAEAPAIVAAAAVARGMRVMHFSTDYVFAGDRERPYGEDDAPAPLSVYARSKLEGEARVLSTGATALVVRVGCLFGDGGRNFPSRVPILLRDGRSVRADDERRGSPSYVDEVADVLSAVAAAGTAGLLHLTAEGEASWADFAREVARVLGRDPATCVEGVPAAAIPARARRPRRAVLAKLRLRALGLPTMRPWQAGVADHVASLTAPR